MVTLYEQQKIHREWLKAAGGDLRAVETAIIEATECAPYEVRAFLEGVLEVVTAGLGPLHVNPDDCRISCGGERCEMLCTFDPSAPGLAAVDG